MKGESNFTGARRWSGIAFLLLIGVIMGFVISSNTDFINKGLAHIQSVRSTAMPKSIYPITPEGKSPFVAIVENVRDAVVNIRAEKTEELTNYQRQWLRFWGYPPNDQKEVSMGTGFFFRQDGYILTNHHVISGSKDITVTLADRAEVKATLVGEDPATDLAVLKISGDGYPHIELGDSDSAKVGEWVMAIGNPFPTQGLDRTVTVGVLSAKGRRGLNFGEDSPEFQDYLQTDAAINPGNSGGPLVNLDGYVIGINSAIASSTGSSAGIGFAIPSNLVKTIAGDILSTGKIQRGWLGVNMQNVSQVVAKANGLNSPRGVLIQNVNPDTPAERGGIKPGDIITKYNDTPIDDVDHFRYLVASAKTGSTVNLQVYRKGYPQSLSVTIGDREKGLASIPKQENDQGDATRSDGGVGDDGQTDAQPSSPKLFLGMAVQTASQELADQFGVDFHEGAMVTFVHPGSPADIQGVTPGTIITEVDHEAVKTADDFNTIKSKLTSRTKPVPMIAYDIRGNIKYFAIKPR